MDDRMRRFVESAPLLFIASRNAAGALDVSPRGGQPAVLRLAPDGRLLLPDVMGNKRLDTIGNILADPQVACVLVRRGSAEVMKFRASAEVSFRPDLMALFPADELRLMGVLALTPRDVEFATTTAFDRAGFWLDPSRRRAPLDLLAVLKADFADHAADGTAPVIKGGEDERLLAAHGIREIYGQQSDLVRTKVYATAKAGTQGYIDEAGFVVIARADADGGIAVDLTGEGPLALEPGSNQAVYRLTLPEGVATVTPPADPAECAVLASVPGRAEIVRMNGTWTDRPTADARQAVAITPREIYFHCPLALTRSRVWMADRPVPWTGRRRFTCLSVKDESPGIRSFVLRPLDKAPLPTVPPGQYVSVSLPDDPAVPPRRRSYSVSAQPDARSLRISVRRIGAGGLSDLLHDRLVPGAEVLLGVPGGRFVLDAGSDRPVLLIAAGVGATPLLPMLAALAATPGAPVWFVQAARDGAHHPFAAEVAALAATARRPVHLRTALSRPRAEDRPDLAGRVTADWLAGQAPIAQADIYICGPDAFMADLESGLATLGADPARIRSERFQDQGGPLAPMATLAARGTPCTVTFRKSGITTTWDPASGTLLDLAIRHRVDLSWSCRMGDCQSCVQKVIDGSVDHVGDDEPMLGDGQVLMCQAVPLGDLVLDC
ncbi:2Fe-2S iron-sulfur cluster-binding protein [Gemmobacter sp.]|uniref:2Fe-2S iron-sulfur cluster-binding protein n=1 Tax=Gemmobacter sp. TaxID=1898957 RepID=UPI002AFF3AEE|nr:2Fe-2S iron-sulfur cluster-binding protein [Gemmobacter sp.]